MGKNVIWDVYFTRLCRRHSRRADMSDTILNFAVVMATVRRRRRCHRYSQSQSRLFLTQGRPRKEHAAASEYLKKR